MFSIAASGNFNAQLSARDLGFALVKHPNRLRSVELPWGKASVFFPEATFERCEAVLIVDVDPIKIVGRGRGPQGRPLAPYVNALPYAASSLLAVAIKKIFSSAFSTSIAEGGAPVGAQPQLLLTRTDPTTKLAARRYFDLEITLPALPVDPDPSIVPALFEPLGWQVEVKGSELDPSFPQWGMSDMVTTTLRGTFTVADALAQVYVLLPVIAGRKHYWVDADEADKLQRFGCQWLETHPKRETIIERYMAGIRYLAQKAEEQLGYDALGNEESETEQTEVPASPLKILRRQAFVEEIEALGAKTVLDLGCGQGELLKELADAQRYVRLIGADVSPRALDQSARRLSGVDGELSANIELIQGSATYTDARFVGMDVITMSEVIEHIEPERLDTVAHVVFGRAKPGAVIVSTPNADYNQQWEGLADGGFRHADHRFEWDETQFRAWCAGVCAKYGYQVRVRQIGEHVEGIGAPTQMAIFSVAKEVQKA